ncbi:UDP-glucuronosyltransferase 1-2 [Amphibalanus amphitrite]|uniref:UDP-glucuronosyltransferase 1-2 n=1 Tax=Amphibalanus amphitrite TaxID=1232801 RepID=A0A6A4W9X8_AMPAM|nr:UDP-glucuronosyltransferase 1-2 [Amphibalanus amphitrite]
MARHHRPALAGVRRLNAEVHPADAIMGPSRSAGVAALLLCLVIGGEAARILMLVPIGGKSQKNIFYGLASGLVERGHDVVFFNGFKPSTPVKGVREVVPDELARIFSDENLPNMFKMNERGMQAGLKQFLTFFSDGPRAALESKELDQLLKEKFDLVVFGGFSYPLYFVAHVLKTPFIILVPVSYFPIFMSPMGNPTLPAIIPTPFVMSTDKMTFMTRVKNVMSHFFLDIVFRRGFSFYSDRLIAEKFGPGVMPPVLDIERNASLLMLSSNPAMDYPKALLPNTIEVGGMHCAEPKPLPKELTTFLGDSEFIFFSLGSVVRPQDMSPEQKASILAALGKLPFKVLLKWDTTDRAGLPANILPSKWLPQQDIIGSSKCRLFVTHGGFGSLVESVCHGTPLLVLPVTGDQQGNAITAERLGMGETLTWDRLNADTLKASIESAMSSERLAAARYRQRLMREQPVPPRHLAVHWAEHVIRHGGAPHLQSVGAELNFFQYYSLDVLAFLLAVLLLALKLLVAMVKCCCRCVCGRKASQEPPKEKSKGKRAKSD